LIVYVLPSGEIVHESARYGATLPSGSMVVSVS
jgi:hypothetical protein